MRSTVAGTRTQDMSVLAGQQWTIPRHSKASTFVNWNQMKELAPQSLCAVSLSNPVVSVQLKPYVETRQWSVGRHKVHSAR